AQCARPHGRLNAIDGRLDHIEVGAGLRNRRLRDADPIYGGQHDQAVSDTTKSDVHVSAPSELPGVGTPYTNSGMPRRDLGVERIEASMSAMDDGGRIDEGWLVNGHGMSVHWH